MSQYLDIFVVPVPKDNVDAYRKEVQAFLGTLKKHGAVSCLEVEGDDIPAGKVTSFPDSVKLKDNETVFLGIVAYRDRLHRDEVNEKFRKDPAISNMDPKSFSFDGMRMFYGGFKPFVTL